MNTSTAYLAIPTSPTGDGGVAPSAPVVTGGGGAIGAATGVSEPDVLAARLAAVETKLDALLGAVTGLRMGSLELLTVREVCEVLKLGRTRVNELIQTGALGMWTLGGERRITRAGLDAYIRTAAAQGAGTVRRGTGAKATGGKTAGVSAIARAAARAGRA